MEERLLTIEEVAEYLQVSTKTVYRMIHRNEIPCYKVANQWRFKWSVLQKWIEERGAYPGQSKESPRDDDNDSTESGE